MAEINLSGKWIAAFREQDGYQMMTLLRKEPLLLRIKYCECNVLHLAVRKRWYGLVLDVLKKFVHLYKDPSFINNASPSHSEAADPEQNSKHHESSPPADSHAETGNSHSNDASALNMDTFRDLLVAKEGGSGPSASTDDAKWKYASNLDVFAMAVIQGHEYISTILVEAVASVDGLFGCHPYRTVIRPATSSSSTDLEISTRSSDLSPRQADLSTYLEISSSSDSEILTRLADLRPHPADLSKHERERKILREIIVECFTKTSREQPDVSSSISATETEATPGSGSGPNLQDKIDPAWRRRWELTSPFLPFEEFFFLTCFQANFYLEPVCRQVLKSCAEKKRLDNVDISFMKYILAIGDTWGTAIHHAMDLGIGTYRVSQVLDMAAAAGCDANVRDGAGRTALHIALALGKDTIAESLLKHIQTDGETHRAKKTPHYDALSGGRYKHFRSLLKRYPREEPRTTRTSRRTCQLANCLWEIDEKTVSEVNGYSPCEFSVRDRRCFDFIIRSPHLLESKRKIVTELLREYNLDLNLCGICPTIDDQDWPMTPLQLAAYVGDVAILLILGHDDRAYDPARLNNLHDNPLSYHQRQKNRDCSALHAAAVAGQPHAIRTILATRKFDPLVKASDGDTALHSATRFQALPQFPHSLADFCEIPDQRIGTSYKASLTAEELRTEASRRQGCIHLLLQAGIDIWQTNYKSEIVDPGPKALSEYSTWWYERLSKETDDAKASLKLAANAISVTAALVATASFVGPLQPPLGYAARSEGLTATMQVDYLSVRIFIVCITVAFYLALAAIMLSLAPSLPMPQESALEEFKLIRRTVTLATAILVLSIVAILVAFASASIAVIPNDESWNHGGLTASTMFIGGFFCVLVLVFCIVFRLLRLAFHKRELVRRLYRKYVCI